MFRSMALWRGARAVAFAVLALSAGGVPSTCLASDGLKLSTEALGQTWNVQTYGLIPGSSNTRIHFDLSLGAGSFAQVTQLSVDYTLRSPSWVGPSEGLRVTTGLWVGPQAGGMNLRLQGGDGPSGVAPASAGWLARGQEATASMSAAYLGFGYNTAWPKLGLSLSADLGMLSGSPGQAVRLGRVFTGNDNLDDMLHDMHMSPLLQLRALYTF